MASDVFESVLSFAVVCVLICFETCYSFRGVLQIHRSFVAGCVLRLQPSFLLSWDCSLPNQQFFVYFWYFFGGFLGGNPGSPACVNG